MTNAATSAVLKRMAANLLWLLADRGMRLAGGFFVGLWLARYLGPHDFGLLSAAAASTWFGVVATQLGLDGLVQRELVHRPEAAGRILGTVTILCSAMAVAAMIVLGLVAQFLVNDPITRQVMLWLAFLAVPQALAAWEYLFQARSDLWPVVVGQNACFVLCLLLRVWLISRHAGVVAFAIVTVVERVVAVLVVITWASRRHGWGQLSFDREFARSIVREAWPVWLSCFLVTIYQKADQIMIAHWRSDAENGGYAAAMRLAELWWSVSMILATAVLPDLVRVSREAGAGYLRMLQRYLDISAAVSIAVALFVSLAAGRLVNMFYGPQYADAAGILVIQFWSAVFIFLSVARGRHLVASGRRITELWFSVGGVAINLALNCLWIPRLGAHGAAWAGFCSQGVVALVLPWFFADTREIARREWDALLFFRRLNFLPKRLTGIESSV